MKASSQFSNVPRSKNQSRKPLAKQLPLPLATQNAVAKEKYMGNLDLSKVADVLGKHLVDVEYKRNKAHFYKSCSSLAIWDEWFHPTPPKDILDAIKVIRKANLESPVKSEWGELKSMTLGALLTKIKIESDFQEVRNAAARKLAK